MDYTPQRAVSRRSRPMAGRTLALAESQRKAQRAARVDLKPAPEKPGRGSALTAEYRHWFARRKRGVLHRGMPDFAAPVERLIDELRHLPGIGQKTAQRLAFHLLRAAPEDALALADAIRDAKEKIRECATGGKITDTDPCL